MFMELKTIFLSFSFTIIFPSVFLLCLSIGQAYDTYKLHKKETFHCCISLLAIITVLFRDYY